MRSCKADARCAIIEAPFVARTHRRAGRESEEIAS
jgi:hypothetical protein